jgi:predicted methyltransferase
MNEQVYCDKGNRSYNQFVFATKNLLKGEQPEVQRILINDYNMLIKKILYRKSRFNQIYG